ncbi:MAG: hypothetical protein HKN84_07790, partial [Gammaproteobacteria bacterium]|nr:hypothetical protein [Gammaproteobacteria bacterium]
MISMDGASLFSSLFARQNVATRIAPPEPTEGDRSGSMSQTAADSGQTATAAALEYRRVERTTLQIRTQEGDVVKLKFRAKDSLSGQSATVENGETTLAELSVRARSTTRLKISVQGDLNSDELAAIQSIVEQAGALANEFFSGGTAEAATLASFLELNPEQLDQVRFRFSLRERLTYTQIGSSPVPQSAPVIESAPTVNDGADPSAAADTAAPLTGTTAPSAPAAASTADPVSPDVESTDLATQAT